MFRTVSEDMGIAGLILGFRAAKERRRYFVTTYLIGWVQAKNQPCIGLQSAGVARC